MVENRNFQPKSLSTSTHPIRNEIFEAEDGNRAIRCVQVTQDEYDALVVERDRLLTWMSHYYEGDTDDSDEVPDDIADMVIVWQDSPPSSDA